ncbi:hypothetical protein MUU72_00675 [Streptomyces sp. RS10V-4]|uniref:hypothetical protein n=1 Tax=Streptomyces rhizoryzae TaxID=2932493 RepID=UPI0020034188|nr:hypothetical protein [Streptomyces rhizoryzae]MCK7621659.1 hypothetical protein [Streptomyces rhizoryzae]
MPAFSAGTARAVRSAEARVRGRWSEYPTIPPPKDAAAEQCINKPKQWRGLATRYDKTATLHLAGLRRAAIFVWSAR